MKKHRNLICSYCGATIEGDIVQCPECLSLTIGIEESDLDEDTGEEDE